MFYAPLVIVHGLFRWLLLLAALAAVGISWAGWLGKKPWDKKARIAGLAYVGLFDLQVLFGLVLYAVSPLIRFAWGDMPAAMKAHDLRFFAVEHSFGMLLALVVAHVGSVRVKKAADDAAKYRNAALFYGASLVIVLGLIPWFRPLLRLGT